jgi:hypothetical protein
VSVRARVKPVHVLEARDALFDDADQHGPRWPVLVRRAAPMVLLLPLMLALSAYEPWRDVVAAVSQGTGADVLLVAPVLASIVLLAAALAPLARVRIEPLLGGGAVLLATAAWLVVQGQLVWSTIPGAVGATLLGLAAARVVRRAVWVLPLLLAAGMSDAHSVAMGVTDRLLEDGVVNGAAGTKVVVEPVLSIDPALVARIDLLVLHVPAATGTWLLGLVDVVALAMLLGLAHLYWLSVRRTALALGGALALAVALGGVVPVLPLLGVAWIAVHARLVWRATRFSLRRLTYLGG